MLTLRKSEDRGHADYGWLKAKYSFSFSRYYDPKFMGWGNLRVINEDVVAPGQGFDEHGHKDMEIITYVITGALSHRDSMGNAATIPPGDIQRMSAGSGVRHSEFSHPEQPTHLLQIWIEPNQRSITPSYEQKTILQEQKVGKLRLLASPTGDQDSVVISADAKLYAGLFDAEQHAALSLDPKRKAYVHLVSGQLSVNDVILNAGDALMIEQEHQLNLSQGIHAEVLVFDLQA